MLGGALDTVQQEVVATKQGKQKPALFGQGVKSSKARAMIQAVVSGALQRLANIVFVFFKNPAASLFLIPNIARPVPYPRAACFSEAPSALWLHPLTCSWPSNADHAHLMTAPYAGKHSSTAGVEPPSLYSQPPGRPYQSFEKLVQHRANLTTKPQGERRAGRTRIGYVC